MSKNIVLCSDGTGNSAAKRGEGTNVWKLFRAVDVHRRNPEGREQMAFYDDGVGSGGMKFLKVLGGAFGLGLNRNIRQLYAFLAHHYDPGDRIYLFGFSRGAFTVRALAGFVHTCGIVDRHKQLEYPWRWWCWLLPWCWGRKGTTWSIEERTRRAFKVYRKVHRAGVSGTGSTLDATLEVSRAFRLEHSVEASAELLSPGCHGPHGVPIEVLGLWDTVDAVGLPIDELTEALDKIFRFNFYRHGLLPCVQRGFHALSIDDQRHTFHPVLWDESSIKPHQEIEQVWFAGVHSNVGGGYPKDQMALVSLDWMMRKVGYDAERNPHGLHFRPALQDEWCQEASVHGKLYDSRSGLSAYYRFQPRDIARLARERQKVGPDRLPSVHASVLERIRNATDNYAPVNLPEEFQVVDLPRRACDEGGGEPVEVAVRSWWEHVGATMRARRNAWKVFEVAWDVVWLRRLQYFALIGLTAFLVVTVAGLESAEQTGSAVPWGPIAPLFAIAGWAMPAALESWLQALRDNPFWLLIFGLLAVTMLIFRSRSILRLEDVGTSAWRHLYGLEANLPSQNALEKVARAIRLSLLAHFARWFSRKVVPWLVLAALAAMIVVAAWSLIVPNAAATGVPTSCGAGVVPRPLDQGPGRPTRFATDCPVHRTDTLLEEGVRYSITVEIGEEWCDASFAAAPDGLRERPEDSTCPAGDGETVSPFEAAAFKLGRPFRRAGGSDWSVLLGVIDGDPEHRFEIGDGLSHYRASKTGQLQLYVNDAVCYVCPSGPWTLYENNQGSATVTVTRLPN